MTDDITLSGAPAPPEGAAYPDAALFGLLEQSRQWWHLIGVYAGLTDTAREDEVRPEDEAKLQQAHESYRRLEFAIFGYSPQSKEGALAKLEFCACRAEDNETPSSLVKALIASLRSSPLILRYTP